MKLIPLHLIATTVLVSIATSTSWSQPITVPPGAIPAVAGAVPKDDLAEIKKELQTIKEKYATKIELSAAVTTLNGVDTKLTAQIEANLKRIEALETVTKKNTTDLRALETKVQEEIKVRIAELQKVADRLEAISSETPEGQFIPNLGNLQKVERFGKVIVTNFMTTPQRITVNGQQRWVKPMNEESEVFDEPPGTVTTTIPGHEGPKYWHLGAGNGYVLNIHIIDR